MKKRDLKNIKKSIIFIIIILIILALFFIFIYPEFTGKLIINSDKFICSDSDGGKNYEIKGNISQGGIIKGTDYCTSDNRLKEYYCLTETSTSHYYYNCPYKCLDGKCIEK